MQRWIVITVLLNEIVRGYHNSCIKKMRAVGVPEGEYVSDFELLDRYGKKNMRMQQTKVCIDEDNNLNGVQFNLVDEVNGDTVELSPIGTMESEESVCGTLILTSPIEVLRASYVEDYGVNAFQMAKLGKSKTYGEIDASNSNVLMWEFDIENFPLIGLYGYQTTRLEVKQINQLGFYTLDVNCALTVPEEEGEDVEFSI